MTWDEQGITDAMKSVAGLDGVGMRDVYRAAYTSLMGLEKGPRLAPILANCKKAEILGLLEKSANHLLQ